MAWDCPEAASGQHSSENKAGKCEWCGRRIAPPAGMPKLDPNMISGLEHAYRYRYDPDYGAS